MRRLATLLTILFVTQGCISIQWEDDDGVQHHLGFLLVRESDGVAKITDFATAQLVNSTDPSEIRGTPAYMAPECVEGKPPDLRSQLYSLAAILHEMLCGEPPFVGETAESTRHAIVHDAPVPITERVDDLAETFKPKATYPKGKSPNPPNPRFFNGVNGDVHFHKQKDGRWRSFQLLPNTEITLSAEAEGQTSTTEKLSRSEGKTNEVVLVLVKKSEQSTE